MPAILRIFLTKIVALVYDITPYAHYGVVMGLRPIHRVYLGDGMWIWNIIRFCRYTITSLE